MRNSNTFKFNYYFDKVRTHTPHIDRKVTSMEMRLEDIMEVIVCFISRDHYVIKVYASFHRPSQLVRKIRQIRYELRWAERSSVLFKYPSSMRRTPITIHCCTLERVYRAVAWQRVDQIRYNINVLLLLTLYPIFNYIDGFPNLLSVHTTGCKESR
jgi:hypothetical protein